jgi:hypothetical protein
MQTFQELIHVFGLILGVILKKDQVGNGLEAQFSAQLVAQKAVSSVEALHNGLLTLRGRGQSAHVTLRQRAVGTQLYVGYSYKFASFLVGWEDLWIFHTPDKLVNQFHEQSA